MSITKSGSENNLALSQFREARLVFWDFDGVIKETLDIKGDAFAGLFSHQPEELRQKIRIHHITHGGMSRFEKIPLYLAWARLPADRDSVQKFCLLFSESVFQKVLEAAWVPGAYRDWEGSGPCLWESGIPGGGGFGRQGCVPAAIGWRSSMTGWNFIGLKNLEGCLS